MALNLQGGDGHRRGIRMPTLLQERSSADQRQTGYTEVTSEHVNARLQQATNTGRTKMACGTANKQTTTVSMLTD